MGHVVDYCGELTAYTREPNVTCAQSILTNTIVAAIRWTTSYLRCKSLFAKVQVKVDSVWAFVAVKSSHLNQCQLARPCNFVSNHPRVQSCSIRSCWCYATTTSCCGQRKPDDTWSIRRQDYEGRIAQHLSIDLNVVAFIAMLVHVRPCYSPTLGYNSSC